MRYDFIWDPVKEQINIAKHGITFSEAATAFYDYLSMTYHDPDHSDDENRFITIGMSSRNRLLIIGHTNRGSKIRIFTARITMKGERKAYEENE